MTSVDLLSHLGELTPAAAERWVAAALAEAAALREHDQQLYPLAEDPVAAETARRLHDAWRRWSGQVEQLLQRLAPRTGRGHHLYGLEDLRFTLGYARCLAQMPPEELVRRRHRAHDGQVLTVEEVRREFGLAHKR
jgi:hypothetical protein